MEEAWLCKDDRPLRNIDDARLRLEDGGALLVRLGVEGRGFGGRFLRFRVGRAASFEPRDVRAQLVEDITQLVNALVDGRLHRAHPAQEEKRHDDDSYKDQ